MNKIKLIIFGIVTVILIALGITVTIQNKKISRLTEDLSYAHANEKALFLRNDSNENKIRSLQFTVEQLDYFNDSIIIELNRARKELKIKDKDLQSLYYLKTLTTKKDTITLTDTVFVENTSIDTTIQDAWHKTRLTLDYPNKVTVTPEFTSDKTIVTYLSKETVKPPKKCKFLRAFQKKHKVIVVQVIENNPYIKTKEQKHIEIIK